MHSEFEGVRVRDQKFTEFGVFGHVTTNLQAKIGKKRTKLNRNVSVGTDIDEKSLCFLSAINHLSFAMFIYPKLNIIFVSACLSYVSFLSELSTFKPLYAQYLNFEPLEMSGRTKSLPKSRLPRWGIFHKRTSKIQSF